MTTARHTLLVIMVKCRANKLLRWLPLVLVVVSLVELVVGQLTLGSLLLSEELLARE